jgi:(p)ppGpp synthase/HD superfamily hydrolase
MNVLIEKARLFALKKHKNQKDDLGLPYFFHVEQVARIVEVVTQDPQIIASAYLHDTLEDTKTTFQELEKEFGLKIANLVYEVTHEGKKDRYGYYFPRLKSKEAILIKFADRLSNLSRMSCWSKKRQEQYLRKSKFWKNNLEE